MSEYSGTGWYTFHKPNDPQVPEAIWIDSIDEYEWVKDEDDLVEYYGCDDLPDGDVKVAERFIATFSYEQKVKYGKVEFK